MSQSFVFSELLFLLALSSVTLFHNLCNFVGRFAFGKHINLMPSVGLYAAYNFTVGKSTLQRLDYDVDDSPAGYTQHRYDPMEGYSYSVPTHNPLYPAEISPSRRWEGGAMGGVKAIIKQHYTFSVDYYQSFSEVQSSNDLRSSGLMISVGCRF